jgi:uncharacterized phage infection (PIP) family protein YhgE
LEEKLSLLNEKLEKANQDRESVKAELQQLHSEFVALKIEKIKIENEYNPCKELTQQLTDQINELTAQNQELNEKIDKANALIENFSKEPDDVWLENFELKQKWEDAENNALNLRSQLTAKNTAYNEISAQLQDAFSKLYAAKADLENAGEWIYPESLSDVVAAGTKYYASNLVFHDRVYQSIASFTAAQSEKKFRIIQEAVKMVKALADTMHRLKFVENNFSEDAFTNLTGIRFSMTERKITKNEKEIEKSRTLKYKGETIIFYPHLKSSIQGTELRIHFQFLENEQKILICHIGDHLPTAGTRQKN